MIGGMEKMVHESKQPIRALPYSFLHPDWRTSDHCLEPSVGSIEHSAEMIFDKVRSGLTHGSGNLLEFIANNFPIIALAV